MQGALEIGAIDPVRQFLLLVEHDERVDAAARAGAGDADEPAARVGREVDREVGDHQETERLGHLAGLSVVLGQRLELVTQILLQHVLHVPSQVR